MQWLALQDPASQLVRNQIIGFRVGMIIQRSHPERIFWPAVFQSIDQFDRRTLSAANTLLIFWCWALKG